MVTTRVWSHACYACARGLERFQNAAVGETNVGFYIGRCGIDTVAPNPRPEHSEQDARLGRPGAQEPHREDGRPERCLTRENKILAFGESVQYY